MPRKSEVPLEKKTMNFFKGDAEKLDEFFPRLGYSQVVRTLTHKFIKRLEEKLNQRGVNHDTRELERSLNADIERSIADELK